MEKILIVDEDREYGEKLKDILEKKGFAVEFLNSGKEAILRVKDEKYNVILMDIKMSAMNGFETFKEIKKIDPDAVVIMMTAYSVEALVQEALAEGAFGVIRKPLDIDKLLGQIELARDKGILVLVTDDDPDTRQVFEDVLRAKGYRVSLASTGEEAIRVMEERPQDVLFIDMKLPTLNGLETYLELKKRNPKVIAVLITGYIQEVKDLVDLAIYRGAYTCLSKPIDMNQVLKIIEDASQGKKPQNK